MKNKLILVTGPTASGKTQFSIEIALNLSLAQKVEIVNFDSILFYQELNIGSAKPTKEEQKNIPHHLIDIVSISNSLNANHFIHLAKEKINELFSQQKVVILVGGSAFYLRALLKGMYEENSTDLVKKKYAGQGIDYVIEYLKINDPKSLEQLHVNDHYRLIRAYEFHLNNGSAISLQKSKTDNEEPYNFNQNIFNAEILNFYLDLDKELHYKLILERTKKMLAQGLVNEVENILKIHPAGLKPLQSIGYKETIDYIKGFIKNENELINLISIATRQLAKSQRTFFKKIAPKILVNPLEDKSNFMRIAEDFINSK